MTDRLPDGHPYYVFPGALSGPPTLPHGDGRQVVGGGDQLHHQHPYTYTPYSALQLDHSPVSLTHRLSYREMESLAEGPPAQEPFYANQAPPSAPSTSGHRASMSMPYGPALPLQGEASSSNKRKHSTDSRDASVLSDSGPPSADGEGSSTEPKPNARTLGAKHRSAMACLLCRKSKMKCEGPSKAPCKRCRETGTECTFELAPGTASRARVGALPGAMSSEAEARLAALEEKLGTLSNLVQSLAWAQDANNAPAPSTALAPSAPSHERRISVLEAKVSRIAGALPAPNSLPSITAMSSAPAPPLPPVASPSPGGSTSTASGRNSMFQSQYEGRYGQNNGRQLPLPSVSPRSFQPESLPGTSEGSARTPTFPASSLRTFPSPRLSGGSGSQSGRPGSLPIYPGQRTETDEDYLMAASKRRLDRVMIFEDQPAGSGKRPKIDDDFITRGLVKEEEATLCYDSYFATLNAQPAEDTPAIHLAYQAVRRGSPLLFSTLTCIGARAISHSSTYHALLEESVSLARRTLLPGPHRLTEIDVKALMLLSIYTGMVGLVGHTAALSNYYKFPSAILDIETSRSQGTLTREEEEIKIAKGRTYLILWIWAALYTFCRRMPALYTMPSEMLMRQVEILTSSEFSLPVDVVIEAHVKQCLICYNVFVALSGTMRVEPLTFDERLTVVDTGIQQMTEWAASSKDVMKTMSQWGDENYTRQVIPFHHGRLILVNWTLDLLEPGSPLLNSARAREHVMMAVESAQIIIRFSTESKIWLPHSTAAQYYSKINLPSALSAYFRAARLYPQDPHVVRGGKALHILQRLRPYLERQVTPLSTDTEVEGVKQLSALVEDFEAFVTEHIDDLGGRAYEDLGNDAISWQADLPKSLESLAADSWLWGAALLDVEALLAA